MAYFRSKSNSFMSWKKYVQVYFHRLARELVPLLTIFFLGLLFLNLFIPKTIFEKTKETVLLNGSDQGAHQILSQLFFAANDLPNAQKELELVNVLSAGQGIALIKNVENRPEEIKREILFWHNLAVEIPGYRDAYIKLAVLSSNLYRDFDARKFLENAREIDPNNPLITKFAESLEGSKD